jgi:hypothetical protein
MSQFEVSTMTSCRLFRPFAVVFFVIYIPTFATGFGQQVMQTKFRTAGESMIVVPVTINGAGPFDFLLDTGSTHTLIDRKLAEELHLPPAGEMIFEMPQRTSTLRLAHTGSVSMGDATVLNLNMAIINRPVEPFPKVRGTLGEDFLRYFDLLIDYRRHLIQFERGPGILGAGLSGEHLQLSDYGLTGEKLTADRLVVVAQFTELYKDAKLLLDSGTSSLLLCSQRSRREIPLKSVTQSGSVIGASGSSMSADAQTGNLRLGNRLFTDVTMILPAQSFPSIDVDGFLPTSLFRSIFISHSGRFVILETPAKPALGKPKPQSGAETEISDESSFPPPSQREELVGDVAEKNFFFKKPQQLRMSSPKTS